jgi:hypothetical protein
MSACFSFGKQIKNEPLCFRVVRVFPVPDLNNQGKVAAIDTTEVYYVYDGDIRAFEIPFYSEEGNNEILSKQYLIYHKDSTVGWLFDQVKDGLYEKIPVISDSYENKFHKLNLHDFFQKMTLIPHQEPEQQRGSWRKEYSFTNKDDSTERGILILGFTDSLSDIPIHLSTYLDSVNHSKLNFYKIISFGGPVSNTNIVVDTLTSIVKLEKAVSPNMDKMTIYINRYKLNARR